MLSVMVITKNEAHHLARCLESVAFASEIIVVDSGSTDGTIEIAKRYTSHVYHADWQGYGIQKQRALSLTTQPWVLNLDADETVDPALALEIQRAIKQNVADAYGMCVRMCFSGKKMRFSVSARHVRLFKRQGVSYEPVPVHEKIQLPPRARVKRLQAPIWHHSFQDVSHMLQKMNRYSSESAKMRLDNQRSSSLLRACAGSGWMFLRCYLLQLGCLDGRLGLLFAIFNAQSSFYRAVKQCYPDRLEV